MAREFFILSTLAHSDPESCFLKDPPEGTDEWTHRMAKGHSMRDVYPRDARVFMHKSKPGFGLPSIVGNTQMFLIVDAKVKAAIEASNVAQIEYLPLSIFNHKRRLASADYCIVNPLGSFDCVDLEASEIEWLEGDIVGVDRYVLDGRKLERAPDLFRIREDPSVYVVSGNLAERLRALPASNLSLTKLEVRG
jgi:hypothetical protein